MGCPNITVIRGIKENSYFKLYNFYFYTVNNHAPVNNLVHLIFAHRGISIILIFCLHTFYVRKPNYDSIRDEKQASHIGRTNIMTFISIINGAT